MAKSKRLTKSLRDDIVTAVLNKTFDKRIEEYGKRKGVIYHELVDKLIPADFKEVLDLLAHCTENSVTAAIGYE